MVGERIRELRQAQRRSLADVAARAKVSIATLSRIENDKQSVDLDMFLTLARALKIAPAALLDDGGAAPRDHATRDEDGGDGTPLVRRIVSLDSRERAGLWRDLATRLRTSRRRATDERQVAQQIDELLAQIDVLREELELVRKSVRRRS